VPILKIQKYLDNSSDLTNTNVSNFYCQLLKDQISSYTEFFVAYTFTSSSVCRQVKVCFAYVTDDCSPCCLISVESIHQPTHSCNHICHYQPVS